MVNLMNPISDTEIEENIAIHRELLLYKLLSSYNLISSSISVQHIHVYVKYQPHHFLINYSRI